MTKIEASEASTRLHDMWRTLLAEGRVHFTRGGRIIAHVALCDDPGERAELLRELADDIGIALDATEPHRS